MFGAHFTILADNHSSTGNYDLVEGFFPANTETPLHLHAKYDEVLYVLEGGFTVYTESGEVSVGPGEQVYVGQNVPHVIVSSSMPVNRALSVSSPSGFAKLICEVGIPAGPDTSTPINSLDMGTYVQLTQETGSQILGSPGARPILKKPAVTEGE